MTTNITILEPTKEAIEEYRTLDIKNVASLPPEYIEALAAGKTIALHDSEHPIFLTMAKPGYPYNSRTVILAYEHVEALSNGKVLTWNDGLSVTFASINTVIIP